MTALQRQARALGEPTRYRIFQLVADAAEPLGVTELSTELGLSPNAIRKHLTQLVEAGLVSERTAAPDGRGRPPLRYSVAPGAEGRWDGIGPYERLSSWLAEVIRTGDSPIDVGRRIGQREDVAHPDQPPVARLVAEMTRQGFEPELHPTDDDGPVDIALRRCPFESAAAADQATVCGLHQGIIEGTVDAIGGLVVDELVVRHPGHHDCHIHCHPVAPAPVAGG